MAAIAPVVAITKPSNAAAVAKSLQLPLLKKAADETQEPVVFYDPEVLKHGNSSGGDDNATRLAALIRSIERNAKLRLFWPFKIQQCFPLAPIEDLRRAHSIEYLENIARISAICLGRDYQIQGEPISCELLQELVGCLQVHSIRMFGDALNIPVSAGSGLFFYSIQSRRNGFVDPKVSDSHLQRLGSGPMVVMIVGPTLIG